MNCRICQTETKKIFNQQILNKYTVDYFECSNCDYIQTERPFWLEEAYSNPINDSDTGLLARNMNLSKITAIIIFFWLDKNKVFVDFAGGYGTLTRLMRDIGFDFYWHDPYTKNILAKGFEYDKNKNTTVELVTAFEFLEHSENPTKEIEEIFKISDNFLFSTFLKPTKKETPRDWFYYGFEHGQHIGFFSKKTLEYLAKEYNLNLYTNNKNIHLLTRNKLSFFSFTLVEKLKRFGAMKIIKRKMVSKTTSDSKFLSNLK